MRSFQKDDFLYTIDSVTDDEIVLANKIYELSEKLEKALLEEDDIPDFLQLQDVKALDASIEQTLSETVRKEFSALNRLESIFSQSREPERNPCAKWVYDDKT